MNKNDDFLSLVLTQLLDTENTKDFRDKTISLFKILPLSSPKILADIEKQLSSIKNLTNKEFVEKNLRAKWFLRWQTDFSKQDTPYFEKYYLSYSAKEKEKLAFLIEKYKINTNNFVVSPLLENLPQLSVALKKYRKKDYEPLRTYINSIGALSSIDTKKVLRTMADSNCQIEEAILADVLKKGENIWQAISPVQEEVLANMLLMAPTDYKTCRQIVIDSYNDHKKEKISVLPLETLVRSVFDEANPFYCLTSMATYASSQHTGSNMETYKLSSKKYLCGLENINFSFQQGDLPIMEENVKIQYGKKFLINHKENVVENILRLSQENTAKIKKILVRHYYMPNIEEFVNDLVSFNQIFLEKKQLGHLLAVPDTPTSTKAKKTIKI